MGKKDGYIWFDGDFVRWQDAKVHVLTHTLHYGLGVFEGIRAYETTNGSALFRLSDHIERLFQSAHIVQINIPFDRQVIHEACLEVVRRNKLTSGYIRPLCFLGDEGMGLRADGLKVHVVVAAWSWDAYLGADGLQQGIRVKTSSYTRHHVNSALCRAKANGHYINSILALQEAVSDGYDEALLLDIQGFVAEGSGENIFLVQDGTLYTPCLTSALAGITRNTIFSLAADRGIAVHEKLITRDQVYIADEAFFTGTAAEVTPIRELDGRVIGSGKRGVITTQLQKDYFDCVQGKTKTHQDWLYLI